MTLRLLLYVILLLAGGPMLAGCAAGDHRRRRRHRHYVMTDQPVPPQGGPVLPGSQPLGQADHPAPVRPAGQESQRFRAQGRLHPARPQDHPDPATVGKGATVTVTLQYALSGGPGAAAGSRSSAACSGRKRLTVLNTETATRENGTWENTLTFAVPDSARPGRYAVRQEISARSRTRTTERGFTGAMTAGPAYSGPAVREQHPRLGNPAAATCSRAASPTPA